MSTFRPVEISVSHAAAAPGEALTDKSGKACSPPSSRNHAIFAMLIAALQRESRTRGELQTALNVAPNTVRRIIDALHDQGVIYVVKRRHNGSRGKPVEVFALNPTPFHFNDDTTISLQ